MKKTIGLSILLLSTLLFVAFRPAAVEADLSGAWEIQRVVEGKPVKQQLLISGNSFAFTEYAAADGAFRYTKGGTWTKEGDRMLVTYEFHTESAEKVGTQESWQTTMKDGKLSLMTKASQGAYIAIDEPKVSPLQGPYLFSGRKKDGVGELRTRSTDGPRKTMKILTGSHFQWIAYNTETKEFFGTGGGSYTAEEGKYVENIEFFSRDNSRVGASLNFQFKVVDGDWHHSGKSSKGAPMYEVWAKRK